MPVVATGGGRGIRGDPAWANCTVPGFYPVGPTGSETSTRIEVGPGGYATCPSVSAPDPDPASSFQRKKQGAHPFSEAPRTKVCLRSMMRRLRTSVRKSAVRRIRAALIRRSLVVTALCARTIDKSPGGNGRSAMRSRLWATRAAVCCTRRAEPFTHKIVSTIMRVS